MGFPEFGGDRESKILKSPTRKLLNVLPQSPKVGDGGTQQSNRSPPGSRWTSCLRAPKLGTGACNV